MRGKFSTVISKGIRNIGLAFLFCSALGIFLLLVVACWPTPAMRPPAKPGQATPTEYLKALHILDKECGKNPGVERDRDTKWLLHGHPTDTVYVLMHGLCNCPKQYEDLGKLLFSQGCNVLIPRTPWHGFSDLMNTGFANLTATEMIGSAEHAVDLAKALGKRVVVVGLSINGTTAAWLAQNRSDIARVVLLSPFFSPAMIPDWSSIPVGHLALRLPNQFIWWNDQEKEKLQGPPYAYPRFPTHVIGEVMQLGERVREQAKSTPFRSGSLLIVTSASDHAACSEATASLVADWRKRRTDAVSTYEFPLAEKVPHDFIDPNQPDQKVNEVYPQLLRLLKQP
jgi:carboxylesterase